MGAELANPADRGFAVTPSDSTLLTGVRSLYVGGAGTVAVVFLNQPGAETAVNLVAVPAGTILPIRVKKVMSTNTTATNIVALG